MERPVITDILRACGFLNLGDDPSPEAKQALETLCEQATGLERKDQVLLRQGATEALVKAGMPKGEAKDPPMTTMDS